MQNPIKAISGFMSNALSGGLWSRWGGGGFWNRLRLFLPGARFDYEREAGDLWSNSVVAIALQWLGDRFPRPVMRVSKIDAKGNYVPLPRHGLVDLWNRPNPHHTRRQYEKAVGLCLKVDGNAYLWKRRNNAGEVIELWWLPHVADMQVCPTWPADGSEFIDGYNVTVEGRTRWFPRSEIIHVKDGIDPRNPRLGLSTVRACLREICTVNEESGYTASILRNGGVIGLALMPAKEGGRIDDPEGLKKRVEDIISGEERGSTVAFKGAVDVKPIGYSPEELALDKLPMSAVARIAAAMGPAAMSLGLPDPNKTYANLAEANEASWSVIISIQETIDEALRWELLPEFGDDPHAYVVERDYTHIPELKEDQDSLSLRMVGEYKGGLRMQNEAREALGLEPDPDGDRFFPGTGGPAGEPAPGTTGQQGDGTEPGSATDSDPADPAAPPNRIGKALAAANGHANGRAATWY